MKKLYFVVLSAALFIAVVGGVYWLSGFHQKAPQTSSPTRNIAPLATSQIAGISNLNSPAPLTRIPLRTTVEEAVASPYAAALKEPGRSKRAWDTNFLTRFQNNPIGSPVQFELTLGRLASGTIQIKNFRDGQLSYLSGTLTEPAAGKFFFFTPPELGKAGKAVGVVEFTGSKQAYRIEPTGPDGEPELWERRLDEVVCMQMPLIDPEQANAPATDVTSLVPLDPQDQSSNYIPPYQNGVVSLQSLPGSKAVMLLDFFGGSTPTWGGVTYPKPSVSTSQIKDLWKRVAEDYIPFNINVTTDIKIFEAAPATSKQRVVFTPSTSAVGAGAAGVAYIGSWNWGSDTVCWSIYTSGKSGGEVGSHEAGHTLGLGHQGTSSSGYYGGHSGSGTTGWAPIMGAGYYQPVVQWAKGEYNDANNTQDALNIIDANNNNVADRTDDTGNTLATARPLDLFANITNNAFAEGVIETTSDTDAFSFHTEGGPVALFVYPSGDWANLAMQLTLCDSNNVVIASNNPQSSLSASLSTNVPTGDYSVKVTGVGRNSPLTNGFSAYASLGYYAVTGTVANARLANLFTISELSTNGTLVGLVPAGFTTTDTLAYAIVAGNSNTAFSINATGALQVASSSAISYEKWSTNQWSPVRFDLRVHITNLINPNLTELNRRVVINLTSANESPTITGFTANLLENTMPGFAVGTVTASDPDAFTILSYSLIAGNSNNAFGIDTNYGTITVRSNLTVATQSVYTLSVRVSDQYPGNPLYATGTVTINVLTNSTPFQPGRIAYALYSGITNNILSALTNSTRFPRDPTSEEWIAQFSGDANQADNYGAAIRGYLIPPASGSYTFWIAADDAAELRISTDTNPANATVRASLTSYSGVKEWTKYSSQKSAAIALSGSQPYYIEVRHKEGTGDDHLEVAWQCTTAGLTGTNIIPANYLAPFYLNYLPHGTGFTARVYKQMFANARVGTVPVSDVNSNDNHTFAIASGNTGNIFMIETNTGIVRVADETALQSTAASSVALKVRITDDGLPPLSVTNNVTLTIAATNSLGVTKVQREYWHNISGSAVTDLTGNAAYPRRPDDLDTLSSLDTAKDVAETYGSRIRGYLKPPVDGDYIFFIASDDSSKLLVSTNDLASGAVSVASISGYSDTNEWTKLASQKSTNITLLASNRYYFEVQHKEGTGGDFVQVAWVIPGSNATNIIQGTNLDAMDINYPPVASNQLWTISTSAAVGANVGTVTASDSSLDQLTYKIVSGNLSNTFTINSDTGKLTVSHRYCLTNLIQPTFTLGVQVQDNGYGGLFPPESTQTVVTVRITDANDYVWDGGNASNSLWSTTDNWVVNKPGNGADVIFLGTARQNNTNDSVTTLGKVTFGTGGYTINSTNTINLNTGMENTGTNRWNPAIILGNHLIVTNQTNQLTLAGPIDKNGKNLTLQINAGKVAVSGGITNGGALVLAGSGLLTLTGTNTYDGGTTLGDVTLNFNSDAAVGASNAPIIFNSSANLQAAASLVMNANRNLILSNGATATLDSQTFTFTILSSISGNGGLIKTGTGTISLAGTNSFTGPVVVGKGSLSLSNSTALGTASAGVSLQADPATVGGPGVQMVLGGGVNIPADPLQMTSVLSNDNRTSLVGSGNTNSWSGPITLSGDGRVGFYGNAASAPFIINGNVNGSPGFLLLRGSGQGVMNGRLNIANTTVYKTDAGTWTLGAISNQWSKLGIANGTVKTAIPNTLDADSVITFGESNANVGTLDLLGCNQQIAGLTVDTNSTAKTSHTIGNSSTAANATLTLAGTNASTFEGAIKDVIGSGNRKVNLQLLSGALTLAGTNNLFSGGLLVSNATLVANSPMGFGTGKGLLTVLAGGILAGTGTISAPVLISPGGSILPEQPGNPQLATLRISNHLALTGSAVLQFNKTGTNLDSDLLICSSNLTLNGQLILTNLGATPLAAGDTLKLFTAGTCSGAFTNIFPAIPVYGCAWDTANLATSGVLGVAPVVTTPTNLASTVTTTGTNDLVFDWPTDRKGWRLIWTTNGINGQAVTNWDTWPGSQSTNRLVIPIDPNIPSAIFRLVYP